MTMIPTYVTKVPNGTEEVITPNPCGICSQVAELDLSQLLAFLTCITW